MLEVKTEQHVYLEVLAWIPDGKWLFFFCGSSRMMYCWYSATASLIKRSSFYRKRHVTLFRDHHPPQENNMMTLLSLASSQCCFHCDVLERTLRRIFCRNLIMDVFLVLKIIFFSEGGHEIPTATKLGSVGRNDQELQANGCRGLLPRQMSNRQRSVADFKKRICIRWCASLPFLTRGGTRLFLCLLVAM